MITRLQILSRDHAKAVHPEIDPVARLHRPTGSYLSDASCEFKDAKGQDSRDLYQVSAHDTYRFDAQYGEGDNLEHPQCMGLASKQFVGAGCSFGS